MVMVSFHRNRTLTDTKTTAKQKEMNYLRSQSMLVSPKSLIIGHSCINQQPNVGMQLNELE